MNDRRTGTVSRWGSLRYGFIRCPDLERDAYFNASFLDDPFYAPREGERVEFTPRALPDGRIQARHVRLAASEESRSSGDHLTVPVLAPEVRTRLLEATRETAPSAPPSPPSLRLPSLPQKLTTRIEAARTALAAERAREERELDRLRREAEETALRRARLAREMEEADRAEERARRAAEEARAKVEAFPGRVPAAEVEAALAFLRETAAGLPDALASRQRRAAELEAARARAVARGSEAALRRYEMARRRLHEATDDLEREAYARLERELRAAGPDFARALDAVESGGSVDVPIVAFLPPEETTGETLFVLPLRLAFLREEPFWRVAAAFWHGVAEVVGEGERGVEHGAVDGLVALRLREVGPGDADVYPYAFDEAWESRPSLARWGLRPAFELVRSSAPPFEPDRRGPEHEEEVRAILDEKGGTLPEVADRLGVPLYEAIEILLGAGLPFADDAVEAGVAQTMGRLLGFLPAGPSPAEGETSPEPSPPAPSSEERLRARILGKLLRDHRVGGRHTAVENVFGHHFADHEKDAAKEEVARLQREGLLLPKQNEGQHHVSINPRRLAAVRRLVEGIRFGPDGERVEGLAGPKLPPPPRPE
ncbi:MAG TPA: hypothetical protein VFI25_18000 [Planctomycetota bacterium]|jgi:hypothetical protein|nr:hypothetical protein [Planctomycetota bacterium]